VAYGVAPAPFLDLYAKVAVSGEPATFEALFSPLDRHFAVSVCSPRKGQFATAFTDIGERKEAEQQICLLNQVYALLSHVNEAIVRSSDRDVLFQETCRIATGHGQFQMAWVGLLDEATGAVQPVAWAGHEAGYLTDVLVTAALTPEGRGPTGTAVREGRVVVCGDFANDSTEAAWREAALARGYRSSIALPLKLGGKVIGALAVYSSEPNFFSALVTESLIEVAADLSFALELLERKRQRELEQEQLRLQHSALEAAANAIVITNREGQIRWVNDAFTRLTGYSREEAIGRNPRVLKSGRHDAEFYRRLWETVVAGSVWQDSLTNKRKDGTLYHEEMTITPVRSQAGEITHFIAIKQDVTERRKLEQQFLRAQRMQSIGLLAGGVAHDLNNVLAPVLLALPLLRTELEPEQRDHILDTLQRSVKRGATIVQQVLTFARGVEVQRVPVQLRHLLKEMVKIAEETFPRDLQVRSTVPANLWLFQGDPTQIHQVLLNLAVNARDAMPAGGQLGFTARNVELQAPLEFMDFEIPPGRYVSVSVTDTGIGIAPDVMERMFEPFFTTKPTGKGTGLGLSTVLGIVKSHGGLVEVQSRRGGGSTFIVYLPAAAVGATAAAFEEAPALPQGQGQTILVVDDEAGIRQVTRSMLEANGYAVITAKDGADALARFGEQGHAIAAVVTDIMMPCMDGLALARALRKLHPRLPLVATTGLMNPPSEPGRTDQLRELGVGHFLHKPFQAADLLTTLQEALTEAHLEAGA
jgi:PAS domain S-box-containing protein